MPLDLYLGQPGDPHPHREHLDPETRRALRRLLLRLPAHLAEAHRGELAGLGQIGHAARLGIAQPSILARRLRALERLRFVHRRLPDLTPGQVRTILRRAGEPAGVIETAGAYWSEHCSERCGVGQSTAWSRLFGRHGLVPRRSHEDGPVGEVARGIETIREWGASWRQR